MAAIKSIHQFVHTLSYGDAISSEVLALQRCFHEIGIDSEIFCINTHPRYKEKTHDYRNFAQICSANFSGSVILHYSLGSPLNDLYAALKNARRSLIFHNLTPAHWFEGINPRIVSDIIRGQEELPKLCALSDRLIADSKYNAAELAALGFNADVLELMIDPARWDVPVNKGIAALISSEPGIHLLHVGRFAPNKKIEDIVKTFYFLHHHINRRSRLWLAGIDIDTELYSFSVKRLVQELHLDQAVNFVGCLDDGELRALYENATVYLCMSEHEGFCLPAVEAMHFGLPVIAYASSALPETIGGGGILIKEKRHPEIAELISHIATDDNFKSRLINQGKLRVADLSYAKFKERALNIFSVERDLSQDVANDAVRQLAR